MNWNNFWFPLFAVAIIIGIIFFQNPAPNVRNLLNKSECQIKILDKDISIFQLYVINNKKINIKKGIIK
jgi:hypothetical protein